MNKYLGLTVGLTVIGSAAFAGRTANSLEGAIKNFAQSQPTAPGNINPNSTNLGRTGSGGNFGTLMMPVPEPAGMAALSVAIGSLLIGRRKAKRL